MTASQMGADASAIATSRGSAGLLSYKVAGAEFKVNDSEGGKADFEGFFSVFNNMDDGGDVILRGAFNKTIKEMGNRVKVLYQHNPMAIIGPRPDILEEQEKGLFAKGRIIKETFWGNEAFVLMKEGALNEGSIGYIPVADKTEWRDDGARLLREVKLFEVSPVPWGMNPLTEVAAIKALWGAHLPGLDHESKQAREVEEYLTALLNITNELKAGRVLSAHNLGIARNARTACQEAVGALDNLIRAAEPDDDDEKSGHSALDTLALFNRLADLEASLGKLAAVA